jgi:hypothetical protein
VGRAFKTALDGIRSHKHLFWATQSQGREPGFRLPHVTPLSDTTSGRLCYRARPTREATTMGRSAATHDIVGHPDARHCAGATTLNNGLSATDGGAVPVQAQAPAPVAAHASG